MTGQQRKLTEGDIFAIPLEDGAYGFCQIARGSNIACFKLRSATFLDLEEIVTAPLLFRVAAENNPPRSGKWVYLGNLPLSGTLADYSEFRNQPVGSNQLYLYKGGILSPATYDQVKDLEVLAWWGAQRIVERLIDNLAGRQNAMTEFMNRVIIYDPETGQKIGTK